MSTKIKECDRGLVRGRVLTTLGLEWPVTRLAD
jgi:hypothetical protein